MDSSIQSFQLFSKVMDDPLGFSKQLANQGKRLLGLLCPILPEELVTASGLTPCRVVLRPEPPKRSTEALQTFCCTWIQALLDQAQAGAFAHLAGLVFSCNSCDSFQNLPDIWRRVVESPPSAEFLFSLRTPVLYQGEAPARFFIEELSAWRKWLERLGGKITSLQLERSARLHNRIRSTLRKLHQYASEGKLPYFWLHAATIAAQSMEREEVADRLDQALTELDGLAIEKAPSDRLRIIVVGAILDHSRPLRWLADHDVHVVTDDTCAIARSFEKEMDLDLTDPLADMAKRHLRRSPCPVHLDSATRRFARLAQQIRQHRVQGVVFFPYKGCEPHGFDNVILAEKLDRQKVPHITLEIDPHLGGWGQITTRLEAFLEMLSDELDDNDLAEVR